MDKVSLEKGKITLTEAIAIILRTLVISIKAKTKLSIAVSITGFAAAFLPTMISRILQRLADIVQEVFGNKTANMTNMFVTFALLAALYLIQLIYNCLRTYYQKTDSNNIHKYIKECVLRHSFTIKYKYLENYENFRERLMFIEGESGYRIAGSMNKIIDCLQNAVTFVSIVVVLSSVDVGITVALFLTCVPAVILSYLQKDEEFMAKTKWNKDRMLISNFYMETNRPYVQNDIRFFGLLDYMNNGRHKQNEVFLETKNKIIGKHALYNSIADLLRNSVYIIILLIVSKRIFDNPAIGLGSFMLVFTLASQFQDTTAKLLIGIIQFFSDIGYMRELFDLDKLEHEDIDSHSEPQQQNDISFNNVYFSYPNTNRQALRGVNVDIRQGEKIAVVGENGSGKTTFVNLLCGIYTPDCGTVKIGGIDISDNLSSARRTISAVFQDFGKYETTIRENITISDPEKQSDDKSLEMLVKRMGLHNLIAGQPGGFDEIVGSFSESGNNLSGGQWQKIALGRAAYRDSARIMILDEPTAALDPVAEANLYRNFSEITGERTTILISHRLGITSLVDRILVFHEGQVVEDGTQSELIAKNGLYAKMYRAQAQWYENDGVA